MTPCPLLQVLFTPLPPMLFLPAKLEDFKDVPHYSCPLYKTSERRGVSPGSSKEKAPTEPHCTRAL